jgi:hypothetical protein
MSLGFSRSGFWIVLLCLAVTGLQVNCAYGQGSQRPHRFIELSETNTAEILTNLNQLTTKKDGFKPLEDQLRSLKSLSGRKSLEERFNAPYIAPRTTIPNKTIKELLERQKNWDLSPEELGTGLSSSDADVLSVFGDGKNDKKSSLQQFYDALNRPGASRQNTGQSTDKGSSSFNQRRDSSEDSWTISASDDSSLPAGIRDKAQKLREQVTQDSSSIFNPVRAHSSFENFFGLTRAPNPAAKGSGAPTSSVDSFLEQFKKGLESSSTISRMDPALQSLLPNANGQKAATLPTYDSMPAPKKHDSTDATPGNVNAVVDRASLPDVNATVLNQWNPMYAPPKLELPKFTPPTPPNLEFPRRKF